MRLEVEITGKTFRSAAGETHEVLAPVKFALQSGEVGVLIGPSGCGKSTMLRIILGLDHEYQGRIARPPEARIRHGVPGAAAAAVALGRTERAAGCARYHRREAVRSVQDFGA